MSRARALESKIRAALAVLEADPCDYETARKLDRWREELLALRLRPPASTPNQETR